MVQQDWAAVFPWEEWANMATSLPNTHATVARDYSPVEWSGSDATADDVVKACVTVLPTSLIEPLWTQITSVKNLHAYDRNEGFDTIYLPRCKVGTAAIFYNALLAGIATVAG